MRRMNSLTEASSTGAGRWPRRRAVLLAWTLGALLGVVSLGLLGLGLLLGDGDNLGPAALLLTALSTAVVLLLVAALGWHVGVRLTRQRLGEALREARLHGHTLAQLQPDWQWATDAEHHLVRWQAPLGVPASSWVGSSATVALWQRFGLDADSGASAGLQECLSSHANFADLSVTSLDASAKRWRLRGVACWDSAGRFSGYQGTAQPVSIAALPVAPASVPLAAPTFDWLDAWPGPAWLLAEASEGGRLTVLALNAAATAATPSGAAMRVGDAWSEASAAQPDSRLCLRPFGASDSRQILALTLPVLDAAVDPQAAANEHASFSYTVSHDLRAPLRVVEGFARILKEDYGRLLDRIGNDHLDRVMGAAARMNSMIDALLSLSQLSSQPLARQPVNLSQLAGFVVEELRRSAPERVVEFDVEPGLQALGDPTLLRMVLENLLGNAWKYSSKNAAAQIRLEARQDDGHWVYCISDNGAGFDMRFADRLFGVFQRLHSASDFQGTGVGLASVRRIVRRHGGDVWAESEVGAGARFYFTLANSSTASTKRSA